MERRALIGIAAGGVLVVAAGGLTGLRLARGNDTFSLDTQPYETASPSPLPTPSAAPTFFFPTVTPEPPVTLSATPTPSATAAPPVVTATPTATVTTAAPTTAPATDPPYRARALPSGCLSYGHACAYPDAKHAVTGGVEDLRCRLMGSSVRITWRSVNGTGPARVEEFVVRLWKQPPGYSGQDMNGPGLYQFRVSRDTLAATVSDLEAGETYSCFVQELNVAGLSPAMDVAEVTIPDRSTPTPSATATPTPDPSATP